MAEDSAPAEGKIRVKIVCPQKIIADTEADSVELPAEQGRRMIIPKQAPLFCLISGGKVVLYQGEKAVKSYIVSAGICEVRRDICAILAWGTDDSDIDTSEIQTEIKEAQEALQSMKFPMACQEVQNRIAYYREILKHIEDKP